MHCLIIANGPPPNLEQVHHEAAKADLIIAADGGTVHLLAAGLYPDVVVGDLDSLSKEVLDDLRAAEVSIQSHPTRKNETDLELALMEAVRRGATAMTILAAIGGRLDQTLANVFLLTLPTLANTPLRLLTATEEAFVVQDRAAITGEVGDIVSLVPLTKRAVGVTTRGLEYPLDDAILAFSPTLGISNELREAEAQVSLTDGLLLVVHTWQHPPYVRPPSPPTASAEVETPAAEEQPPADAQEDAG